MRTEVRPYKIANLQANLYIGETGFEPATARPPAGCATRLRHSPWSGDDNPPRAGDGNRTRPRSLEGFCATTTLRPRVAGMVPSARRSDPVASGCSAPTPPLP